MPLLPLLLLACHPEATDEPVTTEETGPTLATDRPNGEFLLNFSISAVGGLVLPFHAEVESRVDEDGVTRIAQFDLSASDGAEDISEVLASVSDVPYDETGGALLELGNFFLPGAYSPTGGDVNLNLILTLDSSSDQAFCGEASGMIVSFGLDLDGSTFAAAPWADRATASSSACQANDEELERIDAADCPVLTDGRNEGLMSAGLSRNFEVVLPSAYDDASAWPVVLLFHGYGGTGASLLSGTLLDAADREGAILIAPDASDRGGQEAWDVFNDARTNTDLVLFDDLLTCASNTWNIDPDRVHATGMSNGGLFTTLLLAQRSQTLASAAPLSGGLLGELADDFAPPPVQVLWGGDTDIAYNVNFTEQAADLIALLQDHGAFVVACEHDQGHTLDPDFWPFTLDFLLDHPKGVSPEPYAEGLPDSFPEWCTIP